MKLELNYAKRYIKKYSKELTLVEKKSWPSRGLWWWGGIQGCDGKRCRLIVDWAWWEGGRGDGHQGGKEWLRWIGAWSWPWRRRRGGGGGGCWQLPAPVWSRPLSWGHPPPCGSLASLWDSSFCHRCDFEFSQFRLRRYKFSSKGFRL